LEIRRKYKKSENVGNMMEKGFDETRECVR
jgi:hypothetical protein